MSTGVQQHVVLLCSHASIICSKLKLKAQVMHFAKAGMILVVLADACTILSHQWFEYKQDALVAAQELV